RLLHKGRTSEDVNSAPGLSGHAVDFAYHRADLAQLNQQLRRVRRNHQQVRMGLDKDAGFALVRVAQLLPRSDSLIKARVQVERLADANAVGADAASVGKTVRFLQIEAVERLGKFDGERVLPGPARPLKIIACGKRSAA